MTDFYVVDTGLFFDVARRIYETSSEGDRVFYLNLAEIEAFPKIEKSVGAGFPGIIKINTIPWAIIKKENSVFVFTDVGLNFFSNLLKREGFKVFSGLDFLEENRVASLSIASRLGVAVPRRLVFKGLASLLKFRWRRFFNSNRFVVKVSRARGTIETRILESMEDFYSFLEVLNKRLGVLGDFLDIVIQEFIEGTEVAVTAFFNGKDFLMPPFLNFEHEYGGAGLWTESDVFERVLRPLTQFFRNLDFRGIVDANCIKTDDDRIFLLEFTMRFASPGSRLYNRWIQNFSDVVRAVAEGEDAEIVLKPFRVGVYCEGFKDPETVESLSYEIAEDKAEDFEVVIDCPVFDKYGRTYALSFFERLVTLVAYGNSVDEAFDRVKRAERFPGSWTVKTDIEKVREDIKERIKKLGLRFE